MSLTLRDIVLDPQWQIQPPGLPVNDPMTEQTTKALRVMVLWVLLQTLNRPPTDAEIRTAWTQWTSIWKGLP